jgi:PKD repeat protein
VARATASVTQGTVPLTVTFSAEGSFDPDGSALTYDWSFGWSDAAQGPEVTYQYYLTGAFAATLTVTDADGAQSQTVVPIRVGNSMPQIEIEKPTGFVVGENGAFEVAALASDSLEGPDDLRVSWAISLVHNEHEHPYFYTTTGPEGSFVVQPHASAGEVAYYRAIATVVDREGLEARVDRTLREDNQLDIDVGRAAHVEDGTVSFHRPLRGGRLTLPGVSVVPDSLAVEARVDGAWRPVRYLHALSEGDDLQLLFAEVEADAFRVVGVGGGGSVGVHARLDPDADLGGRWTPADVGSPVAPGRTVRTDDGGLILVGGGALTSGAYHFAPAPLAGDGAVTAQVDAISGGTGAGAGVVMRTGLRADADGVGLFVGPEGDLRVHLGGSNVTVLEGQRPLPLWVRMRRVGNQVGAETSTDGESWELVWSGSMATGAVLAGPAVVGGDGEGAVALAWMDSVSLASGTSGGPPQGTFEVLAPYPNPTRSEVTVPIAAGRLGAYDVRVIDRLGRIVLGPARYEVGFPAHLSATLDTRGLSAGVYLLHVVHQESGDVQTQKLSVIR